MTLEEALAIAKEHDVEVTEAMGVGHVINEFSRLSLKKH